MATPRTGKPRGRPRKEDQRRPPNAHMRPHWKLPGYVEKCSVWYGTAQAIDARRRARREPLNENRTLTEAARASGDPLFISDAVAALGAYRGLTIRPSKLPRAILSAIWGSEAERLADYAKDFSRRTGITLRYAVADAIVQAAMRGEFLRADGRPLAFQSAMTAVFDAASAPPARRALGDTGQTLRLKPAREGAIVRCPECNMRPLAANGELVPDNLYWRRRLLNGDVLQVP